MTQPTVYFFFHPTFMYSEDALRRSESMVVCAEVSDSVVRTIESIRHAGVIQYEVRIWIPSKCYHDPLLMDSLKNRTAMTVDSLNTIPDSSINAELDTSIVLKKKPDSNLIEVFFESKMGHGAQSKAVYMDSFLDCFQAALTNQAFTDEANLSALGGLLINRDNPEPSDLQDFEVDVVRVACSKPRSIPVRARTLEEAENIALDIAGNYEYSESEANYEIV